MVPVLDHGEEGGLPYLVQRLIPGGSLADRISVLGKLDLHSRLEAAAFVIENGLLDHLPGEPRSRAIGAS